MKKEIVAFLCLGLLYACSPKISTKLSSGTSYKSLDKDAKLYVYLVDEAMPKELDEIGDISVGGSIYIKECSFKRMLDKAKEEARGLGANVLKIIDYKTPNVFSHACYRVNALLYKGENTIPLEIDKIKKQSVLDTVDYALLNVYRFDGIGIAFNYDLKLGDSVLCRVNSGFKKTIKIRKEGLNTLVSTTGNTTVELPFDVVFGKEYYLRCSLKSGFFRSSPQIELVSFEDGYVEFNSLKE